MAEPAWKKLGLSLKRQADKTDKSAQPGTGEPAAKKAKKEKKPKALRKIQSLESHWDYCTRFVHDRANWKFSKQDQNWLLKHVDLIPEERQDDVFAYLETVQGGSKDRLVEDCKSTAEQWNEQNRPKDKDEQETKKKDYDGNGLKPLKQKEQAKQRTLIAGDHALRARELYKRLTGEHIALLEIDETTLIEEDVEVTDYVE